MISIHAPREGSDPKSSAGTLTRLRFLSTLPARGATFKRDFSNITTIFLSTLPARGATSDPFHVYRFSIISIHAPREGSDVEFLLDFYRQSVISIHAPREGSDEVLQGERHQQRDFYPRSPRGERLSIRDIALIVTLFLSTLPARGATPPTARTVRPCTAFLSTLPARGATSPSPRRHCIASYFYPRSPRGERLAPAVCAAVPSHFYPRSPRGERRPCPHLMPQRP